MIGIAAAHAFRLPQKQLQKLETGLYCWKHDQFWYHHMIWGFFHSAAHIRLWAHLNKRTKYLIFQHILDVLCVCV